MKIYLDHELFTLKNKKKTELIYTEITHGHSYVTYFNLTYMRDIEWIVN